MTHPLTDIIPRRKLRGLTQKAHQLRGMTDAGYRAAGLTDSEIRRIRAAFRLASNVISEPEDSITHPVFFVDYLKRELPVLFEAQQEYFCVIALDCRSKPIGAPIVCTIGTLTHSFVHPRETFREAILRSAHSIITAHNHPAGTLTPSQLDYSVFTRLDDAGETIGIPVSDHLIVSRIGWYSREIAKSTGNGMHFFG